MFYISNVRAWLDEVVQKCNEEGLNPSSAFFMFALFSSLDFEYMSFFKERHEQISSYSGRNFHILTPIVYHNDIVPDEDWRFLRKQFKKSGISVSNKPTLLFFHLEPSNNDGYEPIFFAGFEVPFKILELVLRDIIDVSLDYPPGNPALIPILEEKLSVPNIIRQPVTPDVDVVRAIEQKLSLGKVFLSHSSEDKSFVRRLMSALSTERVDAWLDEREILPGDHIRRIITDGLKASSALVVVLSPSSVKSEWVKFEIAQFIGKDDKHKIIPILLGAKPHDLPAPFREIENFNYIDFSKEADWHKNVRALRSAIESETRRKMSSHTA